MILNISVGTTLAYKIKKQLRFHVAATIILKDLVVVFILESEQNMLKTL